MKKTLILLALGAIVVSVVVFSGSSVRAEIPMLINYQGMLTDDWGAALTDTVYITFRIYNDSLSASPIDLKWEEIHPAVPVIDGLFNVYLGTVDTLDLGFSEDYWLDVTVGTDHMNERVRFSSVAYAYRALVADSALVAGSGGGGITAVGDAASGDAFTQDGAGNTLYFEGTTADTLEIALVGADAAADVTLTLPAATDVLVGRATADTLTNKTLTSPVLNTSVSGSAVLDENDMASDSDTSLATQQSIKAYVDASGGITAVGSMTSGDVFADATATGDWLGLGATAGRIEFDDETTDEVNILDANVGIGTPSPTQSLDVNGNARIRSIGSGTYSAPVNQTSDGTLTTATSDVRLKKNVATIENALDKVLNLRGVTFNWKDDKNHPRRMTGMIAQEVMEVMPELVFRNPADGYYGINYGESSGLLIEAIKELKEHNEVQRNAISALQQRLADLELKVNNGLVSSK